MWFSLGLTLTQHMSGIIIKKISESLAATEEHDFLAKISCVWGYEGGRGERSGISHSNVSFGLNPSEIQWGISVALCFPRAVRCFFGWIKYCNSLMSPRSPIKFKGSNIHSSPLPSWRHFPSLSDTLPAPWPCTTPTGADYRPRHLPGRSGGISSPWQEERNWKTWKRLSVSASVPPRHVLGLATAFRGLKVPWMVFAGAQPQPEPLVGCPSLKQPRAAGRACGSGSWKLGHPLIPGPESFSLHPATRCQGRDKNPSPSPPPPSRLSADLFHVSDVLSHFGCCHYTRLGYFQWKYLRRNENSFGKNKYPELSLLRIAMWWDLERVKRCVKERACLCRKLLWSRTNRASQLSAAVPDQIPVLELVIWKPPAV